jgi:hypothetical protein
MQSVSTKQMIPHCCMCHSAAVLLAPRRLPLAPLPSMPAKLAQLGTLQGRQRLVSANHARQVHFRWDQSRSEAVCIPAVLSGMHLDRALNAYCECIFLTPETRVKIKTNFFVCTANFGVAYCSLNLSMPKPTLQNVAGSTDCKPCATESYSHVPGASTCVKCVAGRPIECLETCEAAPTPSDGYAVARFTGTPELDSFRDASSWPDDIYGAYPPLVGTCNIAASTTSILFFVKGNCEIVIRTLNDPTVTSNGLACSNPTNFEAVITDAFYISEEAIQSKLVGNTGPVWTIEKMPGGEVNIALQTASKNPNYQSGGNVRTTSLTILGSKILTVGTNSCPSGTRLSGSGETTSCEACPAGGYCTSDSNFEQCSPGTANQLLGATAPEACLACQNGNYAPNEGAVDCTSCQGGVVNESKTTCSADENQSCPGATVWSSETDSCVCPAVRTRQNFAKHFACIN